LEYLQSSDYQVDRLFNSDSTTEQIYEELVADLVPFAWNGGIGTLFAYGQTGSGKTFTVSRLEELVAETLMSGTLEGERSICMTIIDLAGNAAFDLLNGREPVSLLDDASGVTHIVGAGEHRVFDVDDMKTLVERATSFRCTAPTLKNPASSRSHAICRIRITNTATASHGFLYMIDLAGSESARDVAVHGADRMRETRQINISLSVLKDCIRGNAQAATAPSSNAANTARKSPHVPFRQSALTRVLKHVFDPASTRACRTVVIACVNPSLADVSPSKNTLRFAELLRVLVPVVPERVAGRQGAMSWTNAQLKTWIDANVRIGLICRTCLPSPSLKLTGNLLQSGTPPIRSSVVAPRESGAQFFNLSSMEIEYRCAKCPGVKPEQAKAFRRKLWLMYINSDT
jgi:kinesin family protein 2/24